MKGERADEQRLAGLGRPPPRLNELRGDEEHERRDRQRDRECHPDRHLVVRAGRVEQDQRAEDDADRAGDGERAVADDERLGREEDRREDHQQHARPGDRQHGCAEQGEDQRDRADGAGEDEAGVPELDDDPERPDREQERDHVRIDEQVEDALPARERDLLDQIIEQSPEWSSAEMWTKQGEISGPVFVSEDAREGATAFAEKREPVWRGL